MVVKMSSPGEAHHPESAERVEWTETRNLATSEGERAARIMAATAEASPELKRLAGVAATGRKLEKPVCHYSLSWAKDEKPDRQEMSRAAAESLKALGGSGERPGGGVEPEQAGVVGALRASPAAAGTVVERLPRGVGPLPGLAGAGRRSARDRRGDPGTNGSAGTLPGGVGEPATLGAGFVGKRAFRSGAGNREQRRENFTAVAWKGRRNGRGRRRGRTGSYWILTVVLTNFTDSSTRCWRSGWSRCGRSTESWLTRR